jgi:phospholipid/cholesterol/gamma-HCH transport system ATP-binding protein
MIRFVGLCKRFGSKQVLDGVDVTIGKGEVFFIIGQSGVGKSVLIKHLIGLLRADQGEIYLDDQEISRLTEREYFRVRRRCGMVFQHSTLFDSLSCIENVALPIRKHKHLGRKKALVEAMRRLEQVHMEEFAWTFPAALGDGMRKRVAIARTLTMDPEFVLFDEPTTGLDPITAAGLDQLVLELRRLLNCTMVVVTHDLRSIHTIADRALMLDRGKIIFDGIVAEAEGSSQPRLRQFFERRPDEAIEELDFDAAGRPGGG